MINMNWCLRDLDLASDAHTDCTNSCSDVSSIHLIEKNCSDIVLRFAARGEDK